MKVVMDSHAASLRIAYLHTDITWGGEEDQLLMLLQRFHARGLFAVLATPSSGVLFARARRVGLRVLPLDNDRRARRQVERDLQEFDLTHVMAHDSHAMAFGIRLRRRLRIPLVLTRAAALPLRRHIDAVIPVSGTDCDIEDTVEATLAALLPIGVDTLE